MSSNGFWKKVAGAFVEFEPSHQGDSLEIRPVETERLVAELDKTSAKPPTVPHPPPSTVGSTLSEIYRELPLVHQTAEQLLTILEGLAAMPEESRRLAIQAMDQADDRWTLDEVLADAERKRDRLSSVIASTEALLAQREQEVLQGKKAADQMLSEAETSIQEQIKALQDELLSFQKAASEKKALLDVELQNAKQTCLHEVERLRQEASRLQRLKEFFKPHVTANTPSVEG